MVIFKVLLPSNLSVLLSICVPTYNRSQELNRLFNSIPSRQEEIELIIVDDGSTDETKSLVNDYAQSCGISVVYDWQANSGRASALKRALSLVKGRYTMIMDSDDYFIDGAIERVLANIRRLEATPRPDQERLVASLVFGVRSVKAAVITDNLPLNCSSQSNFISLRADHHVRGDLKEVARTDLIQANLYDIDPGCRRVPTYLLWASVAQISDCVCIPEVVAVKEYLPGGMTDRILSLKTRNAIPMVRLYSLLSESQVYRSQLYRWKCRLLWGRYAHHAGKLKMNKSWQLFALLVGWIIYTYDRVRLNITY